MAIIIGIIFFMVLVLVHELGHFISAKKTGTKVLEFGIGIPPKVKKIFTDKSGTEYTINLLPLGGFVRLKGEDPKDNEDFLAKDSFITQKLWKKILILFAGVGMNLIFAWLIFTFVFWQGIKPIHIIPDNALPIQSKSYIIASKSFLKEKGFVSGEEKGVPVSIQDVISNQAADKLGIKKGDLITKINQIEVTSLNINLELKKQIGKSFDIEYKRGEQNFTGNIICPENECLLGIIIKGGGTESIKTIKFGFLSAAKAGLDEIMAETELTLNALGNIGKNLFSFNKEKVKSSLNKMSGPVGAVKFGEIILDELGIMSYLAFGGMISLALAIFNFLPIPALDGGRALGIIIQSAFKLKPEKYFTIEGYLNMVFFVLLMGLGIYIIFQDLARFWNVGIPFIN